LPGSIGYSALAALHYSRLMLENHENQLVTNLIKFSNWCTRMIGQVAESGTIH
jgi:hypothetical protein